MSATAIPAVPMPCAIRHDQSQGRVSSATDATSTATLIAAMWDGLQLQWLFARDYRGEVRQ